MVDKVKASRVFTKVNIYVCGVQAGCEFTNCLGTNDESLFPVETYDAIIFHGRDMDSNLKVGFHSNS